MKRVTETTKFKDIVDRATTVWRKPNLFQYGKFWTEETDRLYSELFPEMVIVTYILWGITPAGFPSKCCKFEKIEDRESYELRTGESVVT
jgi:hypothetical protein